MAKPNKSKGANEAGTSKSVNEPAQNEDSGELEMAVNGAVGEPVEGQIAEDDMNAEEVENNEEVQVAGTNETPRKKRQRRKLKRRYEKTSETEKVEDLQVGSTNETPKKKRQRRRLKIKKDETTTVPASSNEEKKEMELAGMIFMCNTATKKDCFKFQVFGLPDQKKHVVEQVKKGMKLFLFDFDRRVLHGIYKASSQGGIDLVPEAFKDSDRKFPAQVRFRIQKDCMPLEENEFKQAIKENYVRANRFKCELSFEQVEKLIRLFRPSDSKKGLPKSKNDNNARRANIRRESSRGPRVGAYPHGGVVEHVPRVAPPAREHVYPYGMERLHTNSTLYPSSGYVSASQAALAEAEAVYRQRLREAQLDATTRVYALDPAGTDSFARNRYDMNLTSQRSVLNDPPPVPRGLDYQRDIPYSSYGGLRTGLPY